MANSAHLSSFAVSPRSLRRLVAMNLAIFILLLVNPSCAVPQKQQEEDLFALTVLHVNDIHVRMEETNKWSVNCKEEDKAQSECYGGVARLSTAVKEGRRRAEEEGGGAVFLNGGDFYQGNAWYTLFKWRVVAHFANILNFTAMSPGNHEFDDHVSGFTPFLRNASFPIVAANVDARLEPELKGLIPPSVVLEVGASGRKVGVIGYVTTDTPDISNSDKVEFLDEVQSIREEAEKLKASGVDILIALGHSGYDRDRAIAAGVPDIDLVVGGHSHSFLHSGEAQPSVEKPEGPYPTLVQQNGTGRTVPVVQAYAYTKYLGKFKMWFDKDGEMVKWEGAPMLLDSSVKQDKEVLKELEPWKVEIEKLANRKVADSRVVLLASRGKETNLGDFVADSMVDWYAQRHGGVSQASNSEGGAWTDVALAFINSGGLRGSFEAGVITESDVLTVLPFGNTVDVVSVTGRTLRQVFERSAGRMSPDGKQTSGGFLQVSGFRLTYDLRRPPGSRVVRLEARCARCRSPRLQPVEPDRVYRVATVSYLADGGDGHVELKEGQLERAKGPRDDEVFKAFARRRSPITAGAEGRVDVVTTEDGDGVCASEASAIRAAFVLVGSALLASQLR